MSTDADMSLFADPRITMREREDGCLLLRSADPLQDYPGTVVHSVWAWAAADPDYPLAASAALTDRGASAVTGPPSLRPPPSARPCWNEAWPTTGRCLCYPATASTTC